MLKSRIGKLPPPNYYMQIMAYLAQAYPDAIITQLSMAGLKEAWDELWLRGRNAEVAAKTTCSCDGKTITLSPAFRLPPLPRGVYRAPTKLQRGQLPDPRLYRETVAIEKAKRQSRLLEAQIGRLKGTTARLDLRAARAGDDRRSELLGKIQAHRSSLAEKEQQAAEIGRTLERLRQEVSAMTGYHGQLFPPPEPPPPKPAKSPKSPKQPKQPKASKPATPPKQPKAPKPPTPPKTPRPPKTAKPPTAPPLPAQPPPAAPKPAKKSKKAASQEKDQLILSAVMNALPALAEKLAGKAK